LKNKTSFRLVSRQQQDRFRNKLLCRLSCCFFATFFCRLILLPFFCCLFCQLLSRLFGACLLGAFLSRQYKCRTILSMQYKSLLHVFGNVGGGSVKVFLRTAYCCQKSSTFNEAFYLRCSLMQNCTSSITMTKNSFYLYSTANLYIWHIWHLAYLALTFKNTI